MGDFLRKELTHDQEALLFYSKVCFMDFVDDREVIPNTASMIFKTSTGLTDEEVRQTFDKACRELSVYPPYRRASETTWAALQRALRELCEPVVRVRLRPARRTIDRLTHYTAHD
ncbi:MAG: hypothetical protein JWQ39_2174 [Glaciihabitans sp.]|nr:hypothetical protein [Glaciihabitans sp.]